MNAYVKTLPISYSEAFTAVPMDQAEMDALIGKTIGELREAGYEDRESDTEGDKIIYVMRVGLFDYSFEVDADFDAYEKAHEDGNDGDLVVKSVIRRAQGKAPGHQLNQRLKDDRQMQEEFLTDLRKRRFAHGV